MRKRRLVIIGAGGHGRVVADIAETLGYREILFLDDEEKQSVPIKGSTDSFKKYADKYSFFVAIGDGRTRERITRMLEECGCDIVTLIHPRAVVSKRAAVGRGAVIMAGAVVGTGTTVGRGAIVNTNSAVDHDCALGDFSHISVGASLGGGVRIDSGSWVGAGATVINNIHVCEDCMIGAGAVVIRDIEVSGTYIGVPARLKN